MTVETLAAWSPRGFSLDDFGLAASVHVCTHTRERA